LPTDKDVEKYLDTAVILKKENPELVYTAVRKVGDGGTATVAIVTRVSD